MVKIWFVADIEYFPEWKKVELIFFIREIRLLPRKCGRWKKIIVWQVSPYNLLDFLCKWWSEHLISSARVGSTQCFAKMPSGEGAATSPLIGVDSLLRRLSPRVRTLLPDVSRSSFSVNHSTRELLSLSRKNFGHKNPQLARLRSCGCPNACFVPSQLLKY